MSSSRIDELKGGRIMMEWTTRRDQRAGSRAGTPVVDERSMRILEILVAGIGLAACALLNLLR